jgi:(1->4)-alpha-D-glucan 1-alpha-D-glucosylmutase
VREAKRRSGWTEPNQPYEQACEAFLRQLLDGRSAPLLLDDIARFVTRIAAAGALGGLSQTLLRLTTPGVPDLYQGCEWWDFSLVDPDNRRPVDYAARARALDGAAPAPLLQQWRDGRVKQYLIARLLDDRRKRPDLFAEGEYRPLQLAGPASKQWLAFARILGADALLVLAPLRPLQLLGGEELRIPGQRLRDTALLLPAPLAAMRFSPLLGSGELRGAAEVPLEAVLGEWPLAALAGTVR